MKCALRKPVWLLDLAFGVAAVWVGAAFALVRTTPLGSGISDPLAFASVVFDVTFGTVLVVVALILLKIEPRRDKPPADATLEKRNDAEHT